MLLRKEEESVIAIPQPSHAWLSGQLARAFGNERFAAPVPNKDVCLAAEQHDIGWLSWEASPVLDERTGLPQEFFALPSRRHIAIWREGVRRASFFGRYPALLVSLHAQTVYTRHFDFDKASPEATKAVRAFLDAQRRFQARMINSLRRDPSMCKQASPDMIDYNRLLIAALDKMSLEICWGVKTRTAIPEVPMTIGESIELSLYPGTDETLVLDPWPFRAARIAVHAEGRRINGRFSTQKELLRALGKAETVRVSAVLCQA
ncbi:MAG TPA: DUF3891 family protein [Methylocella sp.]|nr:DUF3891 family protein [Methylocella sp.]